MFNMTKMELELIPNFDLYILFEKGTKGGISYIFNKYTKRLQKKANFMTKNKNHNILYTQAHIIYMIMQRLNFFEQINSNGQILRNLT